jgi:hypothetical protein
LSQVFGGQLSRSHEDGEAFTEQESGAVRTGLRGPTRDLQGLDDFSHRQPFDVAQDSHGAMSTKALPTVLLEVVRRLLVS